jgi:endonuclease/exonuclease/phosphatase family metal-dependent hydrolase
MPEKITILQLNSYNFFLPEKIFEFIKIHQPDLITMQEVTDGGLNGCEDKITNFFEKIKIEFGYNGIYAPKLGWYDENQKVCNWGNAIFSKLPILDYDIQFQPSQPDYLIYEHKHPYFQINGKDSVEKKHIKYGYSFDHPKNIIFATLKTKNGSLFRLVTTHLTVSYECTETKQMLDQSRFLLARLNQKKEMPTIVAGDFNIHRNSLSVGHFLEQNFVCLNSNSVNTLDKKEHVLFQKFPDHNGLNVDYIFAKGFSSGQAEVYDTTRISDHAPLLGWVEI